MHNPHPKWTMRDWNTQAELVGFEDDNEANYYSYLVRSEREAYESAQDAYEQRLCAELEQEQSRGIAR